jgi:hypothetical protein
MAPEAHYSVHKSPISLRLCITFLNMLLFKMSCEPPKLEDQLLSAVRDCLFTIFVAALHICRPYSSSATWEQAVPLWQGTHSTRQSKRKKWQVQLVVDPTLRQESIRFPARNVQLRLQLSGLITRQTPLSEKLPYRKGLHTATSAHDR